MKIIGTHDEITWLMIQCQKKNNNECQECILYPFCSKEGHNIFKRLKPKTLRAIETGEFQPLLILKGGDKNGNQIQELYDSTES